MLRVARNISNNIDLNTFTGQIYVFFREGEGCLVADPDPSWDRNIKFQKECNAATKSMFWTSLYREGQGTYDTQNLQYDLSVSGDDLRVKATIGLDCGRNCAYYVPGSNYCNAVSSVIYDSKYCNDYRDKLAKEQQPEPIVPPTQGGEGRANICLAGHASGDFDNAIFYFHTFNSNSRYTDWQSNPLCLKTNGDLSPKDDVNAEKTNVIVDTENIYVNYPMFNKNWLIRSYLAGRPGEIPADKSLYYFKIDNFDDQLGECLKQGGISKIKEKCAIFYLLPIN